MGIVGSLVEFDGLVKLSQETQEVENIQGEESSSRTSLAWVWWQPISEISPEGPEHRICS